MRIATVINSRRIRLAYKVIHNELEVYKELYRQCGLLQEKIYRTNLCLTVLGGRLYLKL